MAKIFSAPTQIGLPQIDYRGDWRAQERDYLDKLRAFCKNHGNGALVGEIVREQVADGYAQYMVLKTKPLELIHINLGDGYQSRWAHKWNVTDVRKMVEAQKAMDRIFSKKG